MTHTDPGRRSEGGALRRLGCVGVVMLLSAFLAATAACSSSTPDTPLDVSDSRLAAALLTEADAGEQFTEVARETGQAARETDTVIDAGPTIFSSDDPDCQELFDRLADAAEKRLPDVTVLFMGSESDPGSIWESIRLGPVERVLADERAALDCAQDGFTIHHDARDAQPARMAFVSTPMAIDIPGWDVVANETHSPTGDTEGATAMVTAGRDGLLVSLNVTAASVPAARIRELTATALQRADTELFDSR